LLTSDSEMLTWEDNRETQEEWADQEREQTLQRTVLEEKEEQREMRDAGIDHDEWHSAAGDE
jgi:hypothetical protein